MSEKFSDKLSRLEVISNILEKGECSLEEAVELYQEGVKLAKECNKQLNDAKQKVTTLNPEE